MVTANEDGTVTLWDAAAGAVRETLRGHSNDAAQAVFSPDGKTPVHREQRRDGGRLGRRRAIGA